MLRWGDEIFFCFALGFALLAINAAVIISQFRIWADKDRAFGGEKAETTNTVTLNKDHTAVISIQDVVEGLWTSTGIRIDNETFYEYTIEGEKLYINFDGVWSEFEKETDEKK